MLMININHRTSSKEIMKVEKMIYVAPSVELIEVKVEGGFFDSTPIYGWDDGGTNEEEVYLFYNFRI